MNNKIDIHRPPCLSSHKFTRFRDMGMIQCWIRIPPIAKLFLIASMMSVIGCELYFGAVRDPIWSGFFSIGSISIISLLAILAGGIRCSESAKKFFLLWILWMIILIIGRIFPSPYHSELPWWFYPSMIGFLSSGLLGIYFGHYPEMWLRICELFSWIVAVIGLWYTVVPRIDILNPPNIPSLQQIGYPVAALVDFGLAFFSFAILGSKKVRRRYLIGFALCVLGVFSKMHKPMVFMGIITLLASAIFLVINSNASRTIIRFSTIILISIAMLVMINQVNGGTLLSYARKTILTQYFHLPETNRELLPNSDEIIERLSGGRFEIWKETKTRWFASPIFGSGFNQTIDNHDINSTIVPWHNTWLEIPIASGAVGSILFSGALLWWIKRARVVVKNVNYSKTCVPCIAYLMGVAALHLVASALNFISVTILMGVCVGTVLGQKENIQYRLKQ